MAITAAARRARRSAPAAPAWVGCPAVADGVPDVTRPRETNFAKGRSHQDHGVGGVASQLDPLESLQYRVDEIEAAVDEATRWGTYVAAHAIAPKRSSER